MRPVNFPLAYSCAIPLNPNAALALCALILTQIEPFRFIRRRSLCENSFVERNRTAYNFLKGDGPTCSSSSR
jgi:hypothetical protein